MSQAVGTTKDSMVNSFSQMNLSTQSKPISSIDEFNEKYSVEINNETIEVTERTTTLVRAKLQTKSDDQICEDRDYNSPHFYNGKVYFVLGSEKYTRAKYVYSYHDQQKNIELEYRSLIKPQFFKNVLVNFGTGFNTPGEQRYNFGPNACITIYDLDKSKAAQRISLTDTSSGGWDGEIAQEKEQITAFDHVTGNIHEYDINQYLPKKV